MYLLTSLCFPLRFSSSAFGWQSFLVPALLNSAIRALFCVMTRSSSWHNFISRHVSFPGILCLPTCVFAKLLAYRECIPDLLVEAGKQPYVTTQWFAGATKCRSDGVVYPASVLSSTQSALRGEPVKRGEVGSRSYQRLWTTWEHLAGHTAWAEEAVHTAPF